MNREPQYAHDVCAALHALNAPPALFVVRLPGLPAAGHVVDWLQARCPAWNGFDPVPEFERERLYAEFRAAIKAHAEPVPPEWTATADDWPAPIPLEAAPLPEWPGMCFPR